MNYRARKLNFHKAFSLMEALIALAISAFVMMGVYTMFSSAINTNSALDITNNDLMMQEALQRLIARDIRMMRSDNASLPADPQGKRVLGIVSQNSLTFNKSLPVTIIYEVDNSTLFRRESRADMDYNMSMPLLDNVSAHSEQSFDGSEYRDDFDPRRYIYRFSFTFDNRTLEFTTGRAMEAVQ
ncbi:MAG: prepilin-type N-terminal cleavage/methylation domain-containing protein [Deferribacteraceae bacterium]|jgi:Tfp pilus assembly protein PilW|nr:prepilin-type N-terminal cleavage/methylation domain-containing protein [Deferribacteraceae bacterium]